MLMGKFSKATWYVIGAGFLYFLTMAVRDPVAKPTEYTLMNVEQAKKSSVPVAIHGTPKEINLDLTHPSFIGLEFRLYDSTGDIGCNASGINGSPFHARLANVVVEDSVKNAWRSLPLDPNGQITIKGNRSGNDIDMYGIEVEGRDYGLLKDGPVLF